VRTDWHLFIKMLFDLVDMNSDEYFTLRDDCATRGHEYKLFVNNSRLNIRKHLSLRQRVVAVWNNLEKGVIKFSSLTCFKNSLLLCVLSKYVNFWLGSQMYSRLSNSCIFVCF